MDTARTTFATNLAFEHMGMGPTSGSARTVFRVMPKWAEALRSEKKYRDLPIKLEEKQHGKDSQRKASAQQYILDFGFKVMRSFRNKHGTTNTMREVYWECAIEFRWVWRDTDTPLADRIIRKIHSLNIDFIMTTLFHTLFNFCSNCLSFLYSQAQ